MKEKTKIPKEKIIKVLRSHGIKRAGIFGSYARGEQKKNSDIDILIEFEDDNANLLDFVRIKNELEEVLQKKVDLVEYGAVKQRIKERIFKEEINII